MKLTDDQCAEIRGRLAEADAAKHRKRAERLRRKEAGEVRIEAWIKPDSAKALDDYCQRTGQTRSDGLSHAIWMAFQ